jgi:uncharacterized protein
MKLPSIVFATTLLAGPAFATEAVGYHGPIIDAHAHLRLEADDAVDDGQPIGSAALEQLDRAADVTQSALIVIARRGQIALTRQHNDAVIAAAATSGGRFYAIPSVHPLDGADAIAELDRLAKLNVREIKLHPNTQNFDVADPVVGAVVEHAGALGLVLLFDSYKPWDSSEMGKFVLLAAQHPKTKMVLAHMGFSEFRETITFAKLRKLGIGNNVWFDISAIATTYADSPVEPELVWTMRQIGMNRFLFGSDWPVDTPAAAADAVRRLGLTSAEQALVFHDNAAGLLGLR